MTIDTPNKEDDKKVDDTPPKEPEAGKPEDKKDEGGEKSPQGDEMVEVSAKELNQLKQTKNLTKNLQTENERLRASKTLKKVKAPESEFSLEDPELEKEPSAQAGDESQVAEHIRLQGIINQKVASNKEFLNLISDNELLSQIISNTPLDVLKPEDRANLIDADDAADKIVLALDDMLSNKEEVKDDKEEEKPSPEGVAEPGTVADDKKGDEKTPEKEGAEKVEQDLNKMFK